MTKVNSIKASGKAKPPKPYPGFPLTAHPAGQWCKTINYKLYYFGVWDEPDAAVKKYQHDAPLIKAGLDPKSPLIQIDYDLLTVQDLCNLFLNDKLDQVTSGDLVQTTYRGYELFAKRLVKLMGGTRLIEELKPSDFQDLRKKLTRPTPQKLNGKTVVRTKITAKSTETAVAHIRAIFNYGAKNYYIKSPLPKLWGTKFEKPKRKTIKKESYERGSKLATREEILTLISHATPALKAVILLGVNCGIGNTDAGNIRFENIDFQNQAISLPRQKTGEPRKAMLWPETIAAINESIEKRPEPVNPDDAKIVFLTDSGRSFKAVDHFHPITKRMRALVLKAKIKRPGLTFYSLRHTFQTMADNLTLDFVGVKSIMGHVDSSISGNYRHSITDERLQKISDAVRGWLFEEAGN